MTKEECEINAKQVASVALEHFNYALHKELDKYKGGLLFQGVVIEACSQFMILHFLHIMRKMKMPTETMLNYVGEIMMECFAKEASGETLKAVRIVKSGHKDS